MAGGANPLRLVPRGGIDGYEGEALPSAAADPGSPNGRELARRAIPNALCGRV